MEKGNTYLCRLYVTLLKNCAYSFLFLLMVITPIRSFGTHQRAAEITYRHISGYTYEFTMISYTFTPSLADRPTLEVEWGDGTSDNLPRIQKTPVPGAVDITKNVYVGIHTYSAPATYYVTMEDPNRNAGIINIPYSVNVPMFISTMIIVNPLLGPNSSPLLTFPPIDNGCVGVPFYHNPGAYDPDGDSLSYKLAHCRGEDGLNILGYTYPSASTGFSIDPYSGTVTWDSPIIQGEYNIAIIIEEYRNGILISAITRDMQINIIACNNQPPLISVISDTCVNAGDLLVFNVTGTDPDPDALTLSATGAPFQAPNSPAGFPEVNGTSPITGTFTWQTNCTHVLKNPWPVYFRLEDNNSEVNLISIKTTFITVVAPAPENLLAAPSGNSIILEWEKSICEQAAGYKIYRRTGSYGFIPDHCETGVPAYTGYVQIAQLYDVNDTTYTDDNNGAGLNHGPEYCYMVIAFFDDGAESYASNEACASLKKDVPVITNVSIRETDVVNGSAWVAWSKPSELDSLVYPGPYEYRIFRGQGFQPAALSQIGAYTDLNDTTFIDTLINTKDFPWSYDIELWDLSQSAPQLIGNTGIASSVWLNILPFDQALILQWEYFVPWINTEFTIYRYNTVTTNFDSIGFSISNEFIDTGLDNGTNYCYKVKSSGSYFTPGFINPIENFSQITCESPSDMIPPCAPDLTVIPDCEIPSNMLEWTNPITDCDYSGDTDYYLIYFSPTEDGAFSVIHTENDPYVLQFEHLIGQTIAGCYTIVAVDTTGNISEFADTVCVDIDSCDLYSLPNVFTPNGDGFNDFWIPFPYDFVDHIDLQVFNRWGKVVFETVDPDVGWNGKHYENGDDVAEGVYFFICEVYEIRLSGLTSRTISGSVTILRNPEEKIY
jgi:gliding motility-associated-like protein